MADGAESAILPFVLLIISIPSPLYLIRSLLLSSIVIIIIDIINIIIDLFDFDACFLIIL